MDEFITFITNLKFWTIISPLLTVFLIYYLKEKGKNIATKEDIGKITTEIEKAKHEYSSKLESVKSILGVRLFTHQVRYQNEFDLLVRLSKKLYELNGAIADFESSTRTGSTLKMGQEIRNTFTATKALSEEYQAYKPFYPQEIYDKLIKLNTLTWVKICLKAKKAKLTDRDKISQDLVGLITASEHNKDAKELSDAIEDIYKAIRKRVEYWEQLNID